MHSLPAFKATGIRVMVVRSKTDKAGEGAEIGITRGSAPETCPVRALRAWLRAAKIAEGRCSAG